MLCQHGRARSVAGAAKLRAAGVADVKASDRFSAGVPRADTKLARAQILEGGIEAYSAVDASVPRYPKYTPTFKF